MNLDRNTQSLNADWCRELIPGVAYFTVGYFEPGVNIPAIETYVYLGRTQFEDGSGFAYVFQLAESFADLGDFASLDPAARPDSSLKHLITFNEGSVTGIADIDGLIVLISGLAKRIKLGLGWDRVLPD